MSDDRRTSILEATCRVIARDGLGGVRAATIAREAGVSPALPIYYFGSVDGVVRAAFAHHEEREWGRSNARIETLGDPVATLRYLLFDELETTPAARENAMLWSEIERFALFDDEVRAAVRVRRERYDQRLEQCIVEAGEAGAIPAGVDAESSAHMLSALVDGLALAGRIGVRSNAEARRILERALVDALAG